MYTTGYFGATADFDPGTGTANLTSMGVNDIFVSKFNRSGNFAWARGMGKKDYDFGYGIATNSNGNVYTTGHFSGTADFDPNSSTVNLISAGSYDIFVSKLDNGGNFVWAKNMGGIGSDYGYGIATNSSGNVYTTGSFSSTADFDPDTNIFNLPARGEMTFSSPSWIRMRYPPLVMYLPDIGLGAMLSVYMRQASPAVACSAPCNTAR